MAVIVSGAVPLLVTVTVWGVLWEPTTIDGNVKVLAERVTAGGSATPMPASAIVCGLPPALSLTVSVPVAAATVVGLKTTLTVQAAPGWSTVPAAQVPPLPTAKPLLAVNEFRVRGALPASPNVTFRGALMLLTP